MTDKKRHLFVTTALPYANGPFHIGHIMEYIQADIWVRHERMCGNTVHFVGADDAHGAPIMIAAQKKGVTPQQFVAEIAAGRKEYLDNFFIKFDHWHCTDSPENTELSQDIYRRLKAAGLIYTKDIEQFYDTEKGCSSPTATSRARVRSAAPRTSTVTAAKSADRFIRPRTLWIRKVRFPAPPL